MCGLILCTVVVAIGMKSPSTAMSHARRTFFSPGTTQGVGEDGEHQVHADERLQVPEGHALRCSVPTARPESPHPLAGEYG